MTRSTNDEVSCWACGKNCFAQNEKWINVERSDGLHGHHPHGTHRLFSDGQVKLLAENIQTEILAALCTRNAADCTREGVH